MQTITSILKEEHKKILLLTEAIDKNEEQIKLGKQINIDFYSSVLDFAVNYADKLHHAKEEDILFRELATNELSKTNQKVDHFIHQHSMGRRFMGNLEKAILTANHKEILKNASDYSEMIKEHIEAEDNEVFPFYEEVIPEDTKKEIVEKFNKMNSEDFNDDYFTKYDRILNDIRSKVGLN